MTDAVVRAADGHTNSRIAAVVRWGLGLAVLLELASISPGVMALTSSDKLRAPYFGPAEPISAAVAIGLIVVWAVAGMAFTVGAFTTPAAIVLVGTFIATMLLDEQLYSNHLYLMVLMVGLLAAARPGLALSVDARRHGEQVTGPAWPIRLIRAQISIVYLFAAISKVNAVFLSGTVLNSYLSTDAPLAIPQAWRSFELMASLSILTIILELMLAIGLWLPRWRRTVMVLGLALHLGTIVWMTVPLQLTIFALVMFSGYLAFLSPERGSVTVVWDDSCGFCRQWVTWFRRLDWLAALRFVPISQLPVPGLDVTADQAAAAMHAVTARSTRTGFGAVIRVLGVLPISFLWAVVLELPPIRALGDRAYRAVAARRTCRLSVTPERAG